MSRDDPIRHVLFCVADQWRADALGALGTPGVKTPNLDALAADGVVFANHWCQASPCGPSRASLLTGTGVETHGQWTNDEPARWGELTTLPAMLRTGGVTPTLVGYTDTPQQSGVVDDPARWADLVDPAFEVALPFIWQHGFPAWRDALVAGGYRIDEHHPFGLYAPDGDPDASGLAPAFYRADDSDVAFLTDAALRELGRWVGSALLHLTWLRPHPPMTAPRPYHRLVDPDEVSLPTKPLTVDEETARHPYFDRTVPGRSMTEYLQRRSRLDEVGEREDRLIRAAYYGLCAEVDVQFGRLVAELRRLDRYDSTLIIVTSDHGDALGDHWIYGRRGPFDGHIKVPCLIRDPRRSADAGRGTRVDDFTASIDLVPTICEALGVRAAPTVEGRSLLAQVAGEAPDRWRDHIRFDMSFADHARPTSGPADRFAMVRTADARLVAFPDLPPLLFDTVDDPAEATNRADDPTRRAQLDELLTLTPGDYRSR